MQRELSLAMQREGISDLPLYPEERATVRPTSEQIFRLFSLVERHVLIQVFDPELTDLQKRVLR